MKHVGKLAFVGLLALFLAASIRISRISHTCVVCRLGRVDTAVLGVKLPRYYPTDCSRWYAAQVEPTHSHIWERGTCCYYSNLLGTSSAVGCSPGRFPIGLLDPTTQMRVYQHFKDPMEAKKLFEGLTDAKTHNDRLDEHDEDRGHLMVDSIRAWEEAGFPGTWKEWWDRWYAEHVAEHKKYVEWLNDRTSDLNFGDWKARKKREAKPPTGGGPRR